MASKKHKLATKRYVFLPTRADIREACELIREGWSPKEYRKRSGRGKNFLPWTPPVVTLEPSVARDIEFAQADE